MPRKMLVPLNLLTMTSDPDGGIEGDIYFNVITKNIRINNGTEWIELTPPSTDPTPFYRHTHTFDGDVHTIDIQNPITFLEYNEIASPAVILPQVIGVEAGSPSDDNQQATWETLTLFDGGDVTSPAINIDDTIMDGGNSQDIVGDIVDGGSSL
jgi:hypothetical protein